MRTTQAAGPVERFAADRDRFERVVLRRFGTTLTAEDAEDIVSEALMASASRCPEGTADAGRSWFARVVLNKAEDYRRARDGRPRCARSGGSGEGAGTSRRFVPLQHAIELELLPADELTVGERLEQEIARDDVQATVRRAIATLEPQQAAVLKIRHLGLAGERASRRALAEELGISLWQYESLYTSARRAFAGAVAEAAPTEQCAAIRKLLTDDGHGAHARRFADAHIAACCSCAAFDRQTTQKRAQAVAA
jgi:RNA polymerase sigma factor (sigma-70 family)